MRTDIPSRKVNVGASSDSEDGEEDRSGRSLPRRVRHFIILPEEDEGEAAVQRAAEELRNAFYASVQRRIDAGEISDWSASDDEDHNNDDSRNAEGRRSGHDDRDSDEVRDRVEDDSDCDAGDGSQGDQDRAPPHESSEDEEDCTGGEPAAQRPKMQ